MHAFADYPQPIPADQQTHVYDRAKAHAHNSHLRIYVAAGSICSPDCPALVMLGADDLLPKVPEAQATKAARELRTRKAAL